MLVLLVGPLALSMLARPDHHGPTPRPIEEEHFWDSDRWRVRDEDWRREHPRAAPMPDQVEREIKENPQRHPPEDRTAGREGSPHPAPPRADQSTPPAGTGPPVRP